VALLETSNLTLHPAVSRVVLHGSRGPAGGYRPDSDIDLSLIVDIDSGIPFSQLQSMLREVAQITLSNWKSHVHPDLAIVFDVRKCRLACFEQNAWNDGLCGIGGVDCFGLFKTQKGFDGFVTTAGVHVNRMHPRLKIWSRPSI
jgi:hypothetical protein